MGVFSEVPNIQNLQHYRDGVTGTILDFRIQRTVLGGAGCTTRTLDADVEVNHVAYMM